MVIIHEIRSKLNHEGIFLCNVRTDSGEPKTFTVKCKLVLLIDQNVFFTKIRGYHALIITPMNYHTWGGE